MANPAIVEVINKKTKDVVRYHVEMKMQLALTKIKRGLMRRDEDYVMLVDGGEGVGKSTVAMQLGKFIDPSLELSRITFTADAFHEAIMKASKGQCVIFDEAFTGLSSRSSISKINKMLVSLMMQMRQKNLFIIIVLPSFFELDRYAALHRSRTLVHCWKSKGRRGYYSVFNEKKKRDLWINGKKTYDYGSAMTTFKARFTGKFVLSSKEGVEDEYRAKKLEALRQLQGVDGEDGMKTFKGERLNASIQRKVTLYNYLDLLFHLGEQGLYPFDKVYTKRQIMERLSSYFNQVGVEINWNTLRSVWIDARRDGISPLAIQNKGILYNSPSDNAGNGRVKKALEPIIVVTDAVKASEESAGAPKVRVGGEWKGSIRSTK